MPPFPRLLLPLCIALACAESRAADSSIILRTTGQVAEPLTRLRLAPGPILFDADSIEGLAGQEVEARGRIEFSRPGERLNADWARYVEPDDYLEAKGHIVYRQELNTVWGSSLKLNLTTRLGEFRDARFEFSAKGGLTAHGKADVVHFEGADKYRLDQAIYTTCPLEEPDWELKSADVKLDYVAGIGRARQVRVEYLNIPILYAPSMDFGLDNRRKSGFLAPSYGASDTRGLELTTPWYWNITPNMDATFSPHVMTKRGVQLGTEFRYLERPYHGDVNLDWLPHDFQTSSNRYMVAWRHSQHIDSNWTWNVDAEHVSDDRYFRDLSSLASQTSQALLPRQSDLNYNGGWWNFTGRVMSYQVLQDPAAPITEPYRRLPQLLLSASRDLGKGPHFDLAGEYDRFDHSGDTYVQGGRFYAYPSLSWPLKSSYGTLTPKLGASVTRYDLAVSPLTTQDSLAGIPAPTGGFANTTRGLPMASLDASLVMERETSFRGTGYIQTLEPRAYYVYIPYRDQSRIPVFDTGVADLSLSQLFSENQYIGIDRINDANQFTLALTTRFLESESGIERLQATLGQRYHFSDQQVTLRGVAPRSSNTTDIVALVSGQISNRLGLSSGMQFNTDTHKVVKANLGGTWRQGPGKLINVDYRYVSDTLGSGQALNQIDLSTQWPLAPRWYGLTRINYSIKDSRLVEGLGGFEYNAGCWSLRGLVQRLVTTENTTSSAFYLQLELRGLTMFGPSPLDVLKRSISGYAKSDEIP